ncbi:hypothetical protein ANO11243_073410 [Dothideomycetidae sp. 11243]|nr:hypothetical protein ANO11243_073410 [fungal sp. No.11243]
MGPASRDLNVGRDGRPSGAAEGRIGVRIMTVRRDWTTPFRREKRRDRVRVYRDEYCASRELQMLHAVSWHDLKCGGGQQRIKGTEEQPGRTTKRSKSPTTSSLGPSDDDKSQGSRPPISDPKEGAATWAPCSYAPEWRLKQLFASHAVGELLQVGVSAVTGERLGPRKGPARHQSQQRQQLYCRADQELGSLHLTQCTSAHAHAHAQSPNPR